MNIVVLSWVRAERYCEDSGDPISTVMDRIHTGTWAANKHYKRTGPRTLWINRQEVDNWISKQRPTDMDKFNEGFDRIFKNELRNDAGPRADNSNSTTTGSDGAPQGVQQPAVTGQVERGTSSVQRAETYK